MKYKKTKHEGIYKYTLKSGDFRYRVRVTYLDKFNKQQEISKQNFKSIAEAKTYKSKTETDLDQGKFHSPRQRKTTLKAYWDDFAATKIRLGDWNYDTTSTNQGRMNIWLERFENVELERITRNDIQNYIDELYESDKGYSEATMKGFMRVFNQLINDAVEEDYLTRNKFKKVSTKHPNEKWTPKEKKIDIDVYRKFMALAEEHMRPDIFRCFYLLQFGLRRGEAYGVKQNSIKFLDNGLTQLNINVSRTSAYPNGKDVKSKDSNRIIAVDQKGTDLLKQQIEFARKIKAKYGQTLHVDDFIFIGPSTGKPYHIECLNEHINKIAKLIDPELNLHPHMFRHNFATMASAAGVDSLQLVRYLGHADIDMTKHYTGSTIENAQNVLKIIQKHEA